MLIQITLNKYENRGTYTMKKKELANYTVYIVSEYYKNNIEPFLNSFSEHCIWIGPAEGQIIQTKKALLAAFAQDENQLTFAIQDLHVIPISVNASSTDVILTYTVISYYPNGDTTVFHQRTELLWVLENRPDTNGNPYRDYAVRVCHISNEFPYDANDTIYPNHFTELDIAKLYVGETDLNKFSLKGLHGSYFYLSGSSILWIESKGTHTLIHTANKVYESLETLSAIAEKYHDSLCRVHASYVVNPAYIESIGRFYVMLEDGTQISIPEKKYTAVKKRLNAF